MSLRSYLRVQGKTEVLTLHLVPDVLNNTRHFHSVTALFFLRNFSIRPSITQLYILRFLCSNPLCFLNDLVPRLLGHSCSLLPMEQLLGHDGHFGDA